MNINSQLDYIINLKHQLDSMENSSLIESKIKEAITCLRNIGYSDDEIQEIFKFDYFTEAEDHSEMIKRHQEYIEIVNKLLRKNNNE